MDPRVVRTRQQVLACARDLIAKQGAGRLTFTSLAEQAGVSRNTLYRHWSSPSALIVDVLLGEAPAPLDPAHPGHPSTAEFLRGVRDWLDTPVIAAALTSLMACADQDEVSDQALRELAAAHLRSLASGVRPDSEAAFARLVGPVYYQALVARRPVDDAFLDALAAPEPPPLRATR
jgi:AcrR family transcriptional regulator